MLRNNNYIKIPICLMKRFAKGPSHTMSQATLKPLSDPRGTSWGPLRALLGSSGHLFGSQCAGVRIRIRKCSFWWPSRCPEDSHGPPRRNHFWINSWWKLGSRKHIPFLERSLTKFLTTNSSFAQVRSLANEFSIKKIIIFDVLHFSSLMSIAHLCGASGDPRRASFWTLLKLPMRHAPWKQHDQGVGGRA